MNSDAPTFSSDLEVGQLSHWRMRLDLVGASVAGVLLCIGIFLALRTDYQGSLCSDACSSRDALFIFLGVIAASALFGAVALLPSRIATRYGFIREFDQHTSVSIDSSGVHIKGLGTIAPAQIRRLRAIEDSDDAIDVCTEHLATIRLRAPSSLIMREQLLPALQSLTNRSDKRLST
jgi:hypothetical protein